MYVISRKKITQPHVFAGWSRCLYPTGLDVEVLLGVMKKWEVPKKYFFGTESVEIPVRSIIST